MADISAFMTVLSRAASFSDTGAMLSELRLAMERLMNVTAFESVEILC
jgi:hypothetical protein